LRTLMLNASSFILNSYALAAATLLPPLP